MCPQVLGSEPGNPNKLGSAIILSRTPEEARVSKKGRKIEFSLLTGDGSGVVGWGLGSGVEGWEVG